jgi:hypothetical protein
MPDVDAPVWAPTDAELAFVKAVQLGIDKAVPSDAEVALFESLGGPAILASASRKAYKLRFDRDRAYMPSEGVSNTDEAVRALARALRDLKVPVFKVSGLLGIPTYAVSAMPVKGAAVPAAVPAEAPAA